MRSKQKIYRVLQTESDAVNEYDKTKECYTYLVRCIYIEIRYQHTRK
jgi:hypothetical protein